MQAYVLKLIGFLSGNLMEEIDFVALMEAVAEAEIAGPVSLQTAVQAVEAKADKIFRKNDWFRGMALDFLNHVAKQPSPAPAPKTA